MTWLARWWAQVKLQGEAPAFYIFAVILLLAAVFCVLLSGCGTTKVVRVEVPVPVPCHAPAIPPRPVLPDLKATDTPGERQAKKADALGEALGWGLQLETVLKGVGATPTPTPRPGK